MMNEVEEVGPYLFQYELHVRDLMAMWYALQNKNDHTSVLLAVEICKSFQKEKRYVELDTFLNALPKDDIYFKNEHIIRAEISVAFEKNNFTHVYDLIEHNTFQNGEDLIDIWDRARYAEEIERTRKSLTALSRFRIRQRFLPPKSICPARERRKLSLCETSRRVLQQWLDKNLAHPYPSKEAKDYLSKKANITPDQVKTWFANARRRLAHMEGTERGSSWQKYRRRKSRNVEVQETRFSLSPDDDARSGGECKIIEKPSGQEDDLTLLQREDSNSAIEMTVTSISSDSETSSSLSPNETVSSHCNLRENVTETGLVWDSSHKNSTCKQTTKRLTGVPPLELVEPLVNVNPSLFGPIPLSYFYDYYSSVLFNVPCSSISMKANSEQLERYPMLPLVPYYQEAEQVYPPTTLGTCACSIHCGSPRSMMRFPIRYPETYRPRGEPLEPRWSEVLRFDAAFALLDLSLK